MKCIGFLSVAVIFLVAVFKSVSAENKVLLYPEITHFPQTDLVGAGDVNAGDTLKIPCKARGSKPLTHKWYYNNELINVKGGNCSMGEEGILICTNMQLKNTQQVYQCVVSNQYGTVFSPKRRVDVTAIVRPFKSGPLDNYAKIKYITKHPLSIKCPQHEVHLGANYSWVTGPDLIPLPESRYYVITTDGSLVFTAFTYLNPIFCKVSVGSTSYISHGFGFVAKKYSTSTTSVPSNLPSMAEKPNAVEMALRGREKTLRCIPVIYPVPQIIWWKKGILIDSGQNDIELQSFDRTLVIKKVDEKKHTGKYQCGYRSKKGVQKILATTHLFVTGPPRMMEFPPKDLQTDAPFILRCKAKQMYSQHQDTLYYEWYKNGNGLTSIRDKVILNKNVLTVKATVIEDSGVYQCVARDSQGMTTTATRVHVNATTCRAILPPPNSKFREDVCHVNPLINTGGRCTVLCNRGFFGKGRRDYRKCMDDGGWSVMQYVCEDHEPPTMKRGCPKDIVIATEKNNNTGREVTWKPPVAEDNSRKLVTKIETQGIKGSTHWFPLGVSDVKYTFSDPGGKKVSCQFSVTVFLRTQIVTKPPRVVYILKDKPLVFQCIAVSHFPLYYTWRKSRFTAPDKMIVIKNDSSVQLFEEGKRLVISRVDDGDSGKYTCEAISVYYGVPGIRDTAVTSVEIITEVEWSSWQHWASCKFKKCGTKGSQTRKRDCVKKNTRLVARGCDGENTESKSCSVMCTTQMTPRTTVTLSTGKPFIDGVKNIIVKYDSEARGWLKSHFPKILNFLNTRIGKIAFACALGGTGILIILICWSCSHFLCRRKKKMVQFVDVDINETPARSDDDEKKVNDKEMVDDQDIQDSQEVPAEYFEDVGYYDENYLEFGNPEGYDYYYDDRMYNDEDEEMVYEEMEG